MQEFNTNGQVTPSSPGSIGKSVLTYQILPNRHQLSHKSHIWNIYYATTKLEG